MLNLFIAIIVLFAGQVSAQSWVEPARGSTERAALMDALRPHAEWALGAPVQFVVGELRMSGDVAFASVNAQRPGGAAIDLTHTPMVLRDGWQPHDGDGTALQALYRKSGATWVAVHHEVGATDAWFLWQPLCEQYDAVIGDYCDFN